MKLSLLLRLGVLCLWLPAFLSAQEPAKALPDSLLQALPAKALPDSILPALPADSVPEAEVPEAVAPKTEAVKAEMAKTEAAKDEILKADVPKGKNSKTALLWSLIPGGGQVYNEAYWKIPIVIGIYTACTYAITWNNAALTEYQDAYRDLMSDKPLENTSWQDFIPAGADPESYITNSSFQQQLRRGRDFYRRYRDLSIIVTVGMYLLVALDAYVDAELSAFDVSPNLSLQASPAVISPNPGLGMPVTQAAGVGVSLAFSF